VGGGVWGSKRRGKGKGASVLLLFPAGNRKRKKFCPSGIGVVKGQGEGGEKLVPPPFRWFLWEEGDQVLLLSHPSRERRGI